MSIEGAPIPTDSISFNSAPNSAPNSPRNRVKFLCSHGGKILPRPADGHLKYVGGETRVISVPRDIHFQELMKKLTYLIDGEMVLKYQVLSEDLDALVSVKSDEDLRHMFDEMTHYETLKAPKLRAFLFPSNPQVMENPVPPLDPHAIEQRYIDAVNGIIRTPQFSLKQHPTINSMQQYGSLVSSACSSPRSPDSCTTDAIINSECLLQNGRVHMHRVHSVPTICTLNVPHQIPPQYYHRQQQQPHLSGFQSPKPPLLIRTKLGFRRSLCMLGQWGREQGLNYQINPASQYYYLTSRQNSGAVMSPVSLSPRNGHSGLKVWDNNNPTGGDM